MWMPPQTTVPPLRTARNAARTSGPTGAKMIAASSSTGGRVSEPSAHTAPSSRAKRWVVSRVGEGVDVASLVARDPDQNVGGRAETVDAEPSMFAGHAVGP